jgi:hypothetical protein
MIVMLHSGLPQNSTNNLSFHHILSRKGWCGAYRAANRGEFLSKHPLPYKFFKNGRYHSSNKSKGGQL